MANKVNKSVVGNVIVNNGWNQLVTNGNFSNGTAGWGSVVSTLSVSNGTATLECTGGGSPKLQTELLNTFPANHKFLLSFIFNYTPNEQDMLYFRFGISPNRNSIGTGDASKLYWSSALTANQDNKVEFIMSRNIDCKYLLLGTASENFNGVIMRYKSINLFDLTALFSEGNEPTTVEEFRKYFPEEYYPHHPYHDPNLNWLGDLTYTVVSTF